MTMIVHVRNVHVLYESKFGSAYENVIKTDLLTVDFISSNLSQVIHSHMWEVIYALRYLSQLYT